MNITPHTASLPLATVVNQPTEVLRRENHQREIITQVPATHPALAEKGVASDKERARTPAQTNEQVDFANLRRQAESDSTSISEQKGSQQDNPDSNNNQEDKSAITQQENPQDTPDNDSKKSKEDRHNEILISQLAQRDKEVRAHELAHASTGGSATGSPSYSFEVGPDGKKYAVSGEVSVDLSTIPGDPQATISKMQKVHAAALAPASPSSQDTQVAASAAQKILAAQSELLAMKKDKSSEANTSSSQAVSARSTFHNDNHRDSHSDSSDAFDVLINQTLASQEVIAPSKDDNLQSQEVQQRSQRIESYYFNVSQGYEKPDNFQFELIA